ncbi:MAG: S41 family peptidase [Gemmatimonadaceae bacterium]|nr:S41 family peptidase [Gemmatimonadaceae bacterium]
MSRLRGMAVGAVFGASLAGGGLLLNRSLTSSGGDVSGRRLFDDVLARVQRLYVDSVGVDSLYGKAVSGLLGELHDPYSVFLTANRLSRFRESMSGRYAGIGMQIDVRDRRVIVLATLPGSPAEAAGVEPGDRLVSIGERDATGLTPEEALQSLRGAAGSTVTLALERPGVPAPITLRLVRQVIQRHAVQRAALLDDRAGYIDVRTFSDSTASELAAAVDSLVRAGARSVVLDLRGNPGGLVEQGVAVADLFLDPGQSIVSLVGRTEDVTRRFGDRAAQRWPTLPIVVLVDRSSASAAEIVAGALQDHDRAVVVGQTTFGKGSAQQVFDIGGSGALKLTTSLWFTPLGRSITRRPKLDEDGQPVVARADGAVPDSAEADSTRIPYRTDRGRTVYGGGGITPDVVVRDSATLAQFASLQQALGRHVTTFRDAVTAQALALKASGRLVAADFVVTAEMRAGVGAALRARGADVEDAVLEAHATVVSRLLAYEATRFAFGREAEWQRRTADDVALQRALGLLRGVQGRDALLARAADAARRPAAAGSAGRS